MWDIDLAAEQAGIWVREAWTGVIKGTGASQSYKGNRQRAGSAWSRGGDVRLLFAHLQRQERNHCHIKARMGEACTSLVQWKGSLMWKGSLPIGAVPAH